MKPRLRSVLSTLIFVGAAASSQAGDIKTVGTNGAGGVGATGKNGSSAVAGAGGGGGASNVGNSGKGGDGIVAGGTASSGTSIAPLSPDVGTNTVTSLGTSPLTLSSGALNMEALSIGGGGGGGSGRNNGGANGAGTAGGAGVLTITGSSTAVTVAPSGSPVITSIAVGGSGGGKGAAGNAGSGNNGGAGGAGTLTIADSALLTGTNLQIGGIGGYNTSQGTTGGGSGGNGIVTITGGATLTLSGGITLGQGAATTGSTGRSVGGTGELDIAGGTLNVDGTITLGTLGVLNFGGTVVSSSTATLGGAGTSIVNAGVINFNQSGSFTLPQAISGAGSLVHSAPGTTTLTGAGTYTGDTVVNNGALVLSSTASKTGGGKLVMNGGTYQFGDIPGISATFSGVTGTNAAATVDAGGKMLIVSNATDCTYAGALNGTGGRINKVGAGKQTFIGGGTLSGSTQVNQGTIAGSGFPNSSLLLITGSTIAPGNPIGNYACAGAIFGTSAVLAINLDSSASTAGCLVAGGNVTITGATLTVTDLATTASALPAGTKFTILDYTGSTLTGTFSGLAEEGQLTVGTNIFTIHYNDGGKVTLTATRSSDPYVNWASDHGIPSEVFNDDHNHDGLPNGLAWILGGTPDTAAGSLLQTSQISGGTLLQFNRDPEGAGKATLTVEYTANLTGTWTTVPLTASMTDANGVQVFVESGTPEHIEVYIPASPNAPDGRLFTRLRVSKP
ncbi:MAG: hypothetical protein QM755_02920 [Luteolibacter sp.]